MLLEITTITVKAEYLPKELPAANTGEVYAYALQASRPARFVKTGGNAAWLEVTPEGVLTGRPRSDSPKISVIEVAALTTEGGGDEEPLRGSFVVRVVAGNCAGAGMGLTWCEDREETALRVLREGRPSKERILEFAPASYQDEIQDGSPIDADPRCKVPAIPPATGQQPHGCIVQFDRLGGTTGKLGHYDPGTHTLMWMDEHLQSPAAGTLKSAVILAINGSKLSMSGSVLIGTQPDDYCEFYSWSVVTQTVDSSNNLFYGPSEVTAFCTTDGRPMIVLPVHAIWANVYGVPANTNDPAWKLTGPPPAPHECWTGATLENSPTQGIRVCGLTEPKDQEDAYSDEKPRGNFKKFNFNKALYSGFMEWLINRTELPGVTQGSISLAPVAQVTKSTMDVQFYASWQQHGRPGWWGIQGMYEHDRKPADDLNSLTAAWVYDYRICNGRRYLHEWGLETVSGGTCSPFKEVTEEVKWRSAQSSPRKPWAPSMGIRPPEFLFRAGPEWAPSAETVKVSSTDKVYVPRDLNMVGGSTVRMPIVLNGFGQSWTPSFITIAPLDGVEVGTRMAPHPIGGEWQPRVVLRQVPGVDASVRWPLNLTRSALSNRPITLDFSYRQRLLYRAEPFFDETYFYNQGQKAVMPEVQNTGSRSYTRITYIIPFSAYLQFRTAWQHGQLPPAFQYVGNLWTIGITFSNPGSSEH